MLTYGYEKDLQINGGDNINRREKQVKITASPTLKVKKEISYYSYISHIKRQSWIYSSLLLKLSDNFTTQRLTVFMFYVFHRILHK